MVDREILSREHADLDAIAVQLLEKIKAPQSQMEGLSALRWRLNHMLMVHLAKEDKLLYPTLAATGDASTRLLAARFSEEMGGLAEAYLVYAANWPIEKIQADWAGFGTATRKMMRTLRQRIQREEMELYPRIVARAA